MPRFIAAQLNSSRNSCFQIDLAGYRHNRWGGGDRCIWRSRQVDIKVSRIFLPFTKSRTLPPVETLKT